MRRRLGLLLVTVGAAWTASAFWVGCSSGGGNGNPSPHPSPSFAPPSFKTDIVPIFYATCGAQSSACHSREIYVVDSSNGCRGIISLEDTNLGAVFYSGSNMGLSTGCPDQTLYERIMDYSSQCNSPMERYITPGVKSSSYLWAKIAGGPYCAGSAAMPFDHPIEPEYFDQINYWLSSGAPP